MTDRYARQTLFTAIGKEGQKRLGNISFNIEGYEPAELGIILD